MLISEGIRLRANKRFDPVEIPDTNRDDLPAFFAERGLKTGVEIGVDRGRFTKKLCEAGLKVYGIDPWMSYDGYEREQAELDKRYEETKALLAPHDCTLIRATSMEAVHEFDDNSLDFVYIDGHHGLKYIIEDLWEWNKKIKPLGIISGHDYALNNKPPYHPYALHAKHAVQAFVKSFKVDTWYVLGQYEAPEGEKRDRFRSWFWFRGDI